MKILLVAVNAKYIHSNLAVYSLKANCGRYESQVKLMEYSINQYPEEILRGIYREKADVVCFSCYIWNIQIIEQAARWLKMVSPEIRIWLGGPEVSFDVRERLTDWTFIDGIMYGEGIRSGIWLPAGMAQRISKAWKGLDTGIRMAGYMCIRPEILWI